MVNVRKRSRYKLNPFTVGDLGIYVVILLLMAVTIYPILNVFAISLSSQSAALMNPFMIIPKDLDLANYKWVLKHPLIWSSYRNTLVITVAGVFFSMALTTTFAYPLSIEGLRGKKFFTSVLIFTMFFNGGLIPNFYLIQSLGMYDTLFALFIPGALSAYNTVLMCNFLKGIPSSLKEAARIDGANETCLFFRIILPLSKPILATLSLFYAVGKWNSFFEAVVYIREQEKWTLQLLLREILFAAESILDDGTSTEITVEGMKYAVIMVSIIPMMCIYPFIQKYFTKGIMLGAVKG
ncbi:MAG: carbohydrate ABC transporter permease [Candidatus Merdivicinus sp.]|jgi:putative aldouronate transport system permease protein